jgi:hypothetical protein
MEDVNRSVQRVRDNRDNRDNRVNRVNRDYPDEAEKRGRAAKPVTGLPPLNPRIRAGIRSLV